MVDLINMVISFCILYFGNKLFPSHIVADSVQTIILCTLIVYVVHTIIGFLFILISQLIDLDSKAIIILGLIISLSMVAVSLLVCTKLLSGFEINGVLTYVLLTVAYISLSVTRKKSK